MLKDPIHTYVCVCMCIVLSYARGCCVVVVFVLYVLLAFNLLLFYNKLLALNALGFPWPEILCLFVPLQHTVIQLYIHTPATLALSGTVRWFVNYKCLYAFGFETKESFSLQF